MSPATREVPAEFDAMQADRLGMVTYEAWVARRAPDSGAQSWGQLSPAQQRDWIRAALVAVSAAVILATVQPEPVDPNQTVLFS